MTHPVETSYLGLAPFLRLNLAGSDLRPIAQALLEKAEQNQENAYLWMNLSTAFFCIGQREHGLLIQQQALCMQRSYRVAAATQPARFRLMVLMVAGDISENTPIDCLLEGSDIDLLYYFATSESPLPDDIPEHDALLVAICDAEANHPVLRRSRRFWRVGPPRHQRPATHHQYRTRYRQRSFAAGDGLLMPPTRQRDRAALQAIVRGDSQIDDVFEGCRFPIILRPVGSHAGRDLDKIEDPQGIREYLARVPEADFFISRFIDYSGPDGLFRKFRIALIAGQPFACHMGISSHWMIHYLNAGMYDDANKRAEERASWMASRRLPSGTRRR
jgi:hypothetical protein